MSDGMMRLVIRLKDGREFSAVHHYLAALSRIEAAQKHPNFLDFDLKPAGRRA